jgi:hypothetical protein
MQVHSRSNGYKARSIPTSYRKSFIVAVCFACLHYLCLVGLITSCALFARYRNLETCYIILGLLAACMATWIISFFLRHVARCPLCRGTPLLNTGAETHRDAFRIRPFNHGTTATLQISCCQRFRCMYCGSRYDMLKPVS